MEDARGRRNRTSRQEEGLCPKSAEGEKKLVSRIHFAIQSMVYESTQACAPSRAQSL